MIHARATDPQTSHDAAAKVSRRADKLRQSVLDAFRQRGDMIDEALIALFPNEADSTIRGTRSRLVKEGVLADKGERRQNSRGNSMTLWGISLEYARTNPGDDPQATLF